MVINTETGEMELDGIKINENIKVDDFKKYEENGLVHINDRGNGYGIITILNSVKCNGILATVKVFLEKSGLRVYIYPVSPNEDMLVASKKWLDGMINDERLTSSNESVSLKYDWGYIVAQYVPDRDYGTVGGEIQIAYEEEK